MSNRTNTQMMISFAQNEAHLADQLAQIAMKKHYTMSGWIREQIRQEYKNLDLVEFRRTDETKGITNSRDL